MNTLRSFLLLKALSEQERPPHDLADFRRLVGPSGRLSSMTATCFLLYRRDRNEGGAARTFLEQVIPRLLAQLHRSTHPQRVQLRGRARGSVDWSGTVKARAGASQDSTIFVCRQSWRLYDLPENRLLKYVLTGLHRCHGRAPEEVRDWAAWSTEASARVGDQLAVVAHRLRGSLRNAYLRDIQLPASIRQEHEMAARTARNPYYAKLADFHALFRRVVEFPEWEIWREVVRQSASLLPEADTRSLLRLHRFG